MLTDGAILLRPYRMGDLEAVYQAVIESLADLVPYMPWCHPEYSRDDTSVWLSGREAAWDAGSDYGFGVFEPAGRFLGGVGLNQLNPIHRMANLGYWVRSSATRRGVATAATRLCARFAFQALGMQRVEIVTAAANTGSQRVAEKAGATREALARKRLLIKGKPHDAVVFSLVAEDVG